MKRWGKIFADAVRNWIADNVFKHAASVSFYTLFSLAPITIIAITVAGVFFGDAAAQGRLAEEISGLIGKEGAVVVEKAVEESRPEITGWWPTTLGIVVLLAGATAVFAQLQDSLNAIWCVAAKPSRSGIVVLLIRRLLSLALVLTVGFLLLVSLVLSTAVAAVIEFAGGLIQVSPALLRITDMLINLGVITVLFMMIFKVLPDVELRWRDVARGAFVTALLFTGGRFLISLYLGQSSVASAYGAAGSLVAVLLWVYYSSLILFFGAEFTRAYLRAHGRPAPPKSKAVRIKKVFLEDNEAV